MLKITQAKAGSTMMELILVSVMVGAASLVVLDNNLSKIDYKDGEYDANKTADVLEETLMHHPINSMIRPMLYTMEQGEADKRNEIILRQGFSEISQETLDEVRDRHFKHGVTSEKHPITVTASEQYYALSTMIKGKEVCAGFTSKIKSNGDWTSISINGSKLKLSIASGGEIGSLCNDDSAEYDVILEYCQPTAILTCA